MLSTVRECLLGLALCLSFSLAQAAPILQMSGGTLIGAKGIDVDGAFYDVAFKEGTCITVFGCTQATDFAFHTQELAEAASHALLGHVIVDGPIGNFFSNAGLVLGCTAENCQFLTPYALPGGGLVSIVFAQSGRFTPPDFVIPLHVGIPFDTSPNNAAVYAVWSAAVVPVPSTLACFALGMLMLVAWARSNTVRPGCRPVGRSG